MMVSRNDLHRAVYSNHVDETRHLLELHLEYLHQQDENGDQPAHIAARLGHVDCMKVLVEYDAKMGRQNFIGRTPIGEARFHGNKDVVTLLKQHYVFDSNHIPKTQQQQQQWDYPC